jgi:ribosomal protein S17E
MDLSHTKTLKDIGERIEQLFKKYEEDFQAEFIQNQKIIKTQQTVQIE